MTIDDLRIMRSEELKMKQLWMENPDRHLDEPCSRDSIQDILLRSFNQNPSILEDDLNTFIPENTFIPKELDCSFVQHLRYTPVFWHKHEFFELLCVISGSCENIFHKETLYMQKGDVCVHAPSTVHCVKAFTDEAILMNIVIRKSTFDRSFFGILEEESILSDFFHTAFRKPKEMPYLLFRTGGDAKIRSLLLESMSVFSNEGKYKKPLLNSLLSEMIIRIFLDYEDTLIIPGSDNKTTSHKDWFEILQYAQQNYRSISMQDLAARFNYSERQIQRIFIQTTGSSFRDTVQRQKMNAAAEMLRSTDKTVGTIADEVGFQAINNFRKLFYRHYNMTPSEYRAKFNL